MNLITVARKPEKNLLTKVLALWTRNTGVTATLPQKVFWVLFPQPIPCFVNQKYRGNRYSTTKSSFRTTNPISRHRKFNVILEGQSRYGILCHNRDLKLHSVDQKHHSLMISLTDQQCHAQIRKQLSNVFSSSNFLWFRDRRKKSYIDLFFTYLGWLCICLVHWNPVVVRRKQKQWLNLYRSVIKTCLFYLFILVGGVLDCQYQMFFLFNFVELFRKYVVFVIITKPVSVQK